MNETLKRVLMILITLIIPFFLMMTSIRILFSPVFIQLEYRAPGFPEDLYGFTLEDRLHWSRVSLDYLLNNEGIEYLGDQRLPDGSPLYNERELSHMLDVKILVQQMIRVWSVLLIVFVGLVLWAWRGGWMPAFLRALSNGGKLTLALIALILVGVAISFRQLFTYFHQIFFTGDTWLFNYSDTLIRLFPLRLWQDGFIAMGVLTILGAAALILIHRKWGKTTSTDVAAA
jgi:integral membrane protein (TIGR01906 family)